MPQTITIPAVTFPIDQAKIRETTMFLQAALRGLGKMELQVCAMLELVQTTCEHEYNGGVCGKCQQSLSD